jgi:predicted nucleotidyltransferase
VPTPIQIAEADWEQVQRILQTHLSDMEVWAFGSRARHTAKPYSDLDLALISNAPLSLQRLADITSAFEESDLTIRVDVVDWATSSQTFRDVIAKDKIVLQQVNH